MGIYTNYSCPKCATTLEFLVPHKSRGVGEPFRVCPKCYAFVNVTELFNEWELMTDAEKSDMESRVFWTALQGGGLWGGVLGAVGTVAFIGGLPRHLAIDNWAGPMLIGLVVGWVIGTLLHLPAAREELKTQIDASNARMKDPEHRKVLVSLGYLPVATNATQQVAAADGPPAPSSNRGSP